MALALNTNINSLTVQRGLNHSQQSLQRSLSNLASGLRIGAAKDDVAGVAVDVRFSARVTGLKEAMRNTNEAISLAQTAEGALQEVSGNLQRIRELAVQSANGTYNSGDRTSLQKEVSALQGEISRVINFVEFNGTKVLSASTTVTFQLGYAEKASTNQVQLTLHALQNSDGNGIGSALGGALGIDTATAARSAITLVDKMLDRISATRADFGTLHNRFESVGRFLDGTREQLAAARSRITDADYAGEVANLTRSRILQQTGIAMLSQANAGPSTVLSLLA
ncbi:flagellin N-terminal helical domain-containing protein [Endothiovibrio diazotrophicus]